MQEACQQDGQHQHTRDYNGRNDEGQEVVGRGDDSVEDGIAGAGVSVLVARSAGGGNGGHVESARGFLDGVNIDQLKDRVAVLCGFSRFQFAFSRFWEPFQVLTSPPPPTKKNFPPEIMASSGLYLYYLDQQFTVLNNHLCKLDATLRDTEHTIHITYYGLMFRE